MERDRSADTALDRRSLDGSPANPAPTGAALISVQGISKRYGPVEALSDVSMALESGSIHAVCGENGAGKSTLVKVLTGMVRPDQGSVLLEGRRTMIEGARHAQSLGIAVVAQELSLCPDLSVEDNIWLGSLGVPFFHRRERLTRRAKSVMETLGLGYIGLDTPAGRLRLGERQLIEIARALVRNARILILDEPTATLSDREIERLFAALAALKAAGCAIAYISHRLNEVFALCDTVTVLRNGRHILTCPAPALGRDKLIEHMLGRTFLEMFPAATPPVSGAMAVAIRRLHVPGRVDAFDADAQGGRILCIAGQAGSGAADVIDALAGLLPEASAGLSAGGVKLPMGPAAKSMSNGFLLVSGDRAKEGIFVNLRVGENLVATSLGRFAWSGVLNRFAMARFARDVARRVNVDARRLRSWAHELSGGNQQKLAFARYIGRDGHGVLLLNEPTRGIDVGARAEIYRLMRDFCTRGYALIMTSSDLEEIAGMGDTVITMYRGKIVRTYQRGKVTVNQIVADITHPDEARAGGVPAG